MPEELMLSHQKLDSHPHSDSEDDDFEIIEMNDFLDDTDLSPWDTDSHPLYFPPMVEFDHPSFNRWSALNIFSIDNWYTYLEDFTFKSNWIDLTYEDILSLVGRCTNDSQLTTLKNKIDMALAEFSTKGAFTRLATRSPKDSPFLYDLAVDIMCIDKLYWPNLDNSNQQLVSLVNSLTQAMKVHSSEKIIQMIQTSNRTHLDFVSMLSLSNAETLSSKLYLREWVDIRPDHEFRVFVSKRGRNETIVTAISQYFHFLVFDNAPKNNLTSLSSIEHENIKNAITEYILQNIGPNLAPLISQVQALRNIQEYIVDIALVLISDEVKTSAYRDSLEIRGMTYKIMLIEINPFSPAVTSSALFDWHEDFNILWGLAEVDYPVYKIRTSPEISLDTVTLLPPNHQHLIDKAVSKRTSLMLHRDRLAFFKPNNRESVEVNNASHSAPYKPLMTERGWL